LITQAQPKDFGPLFGYRATGGETIAFKITEAPELYKISKVNALRELQVISVSAHRSAWVAAILAPATTTEKLLDRNRGAYDLNLLSLPDHFKNDRLIVPIDFFQSGVFRSDLQEISVIEIGVNVTGVKCGGNNL